MRPSDEHQHGSTRPNLLSGGRRRFSGDDNILERLERDSARHASGNRNRAAWYAASAALVLLVVACVAWMAFDNANSVQVIPMASAPAEARPALAAMDPPPLTYAQPTQPVSTTPSTVPEASGAVSMNASSSHARAGAIAALPPLVLLQGHESGGNHAVRSGQASASAPVAPAPRVKAVTQANQLGARVAPAARTSLKPTVAARARQPAPAATAEPPVDADVALLSAIIIHDSSHAAEKAQLEAAAVCARNAQKKCGSRTPVGRD